MFFNSEKLRKPFLSTVTILFLIFNATYGSTEILKLKNGRSINGIIIKETADTIVMDIGAGEIIVNKKDLSSIDKSQTQEEKNAAFYYIRAQNLLRYPGSKDLQDRLKLIIKNGWQSNNEDLKNVLKENEPCIGEFKKGVLLKNCDFDLGEKYKYLIDKKLPPIANLKRLSELVMLQARYYEKERDFSRAKDLYLSLLTFTYHLSQHDMLISKMISLVIEKNVYESVKNFLNFKEVSKNDRQDILTYLKNHEKQHFLARQLVESEKEFFVSTTQKMADDVKQKNKEEFANELINQAHELADRYYGNFIKAAETNSESDWKFATDEFRVFINNARPANVNNIQEATAFLYDIVTKNKEGLDKKVARKVVTITLAISAPDFRKAVDAYYTNLNTLKELQQLASK